MTGLRCEVRPGTVPNLRSNGLLSTTAEASIQDLGERFHAVRQRGQGGGRGRRPPPSGGGRLTAASAVRAPTSSTVLALLATGRIVGLPAFPSPCGAAARVGLRRQPMPFHPVPTCGGGAAKSAIRRSHTTSVQPLRWGDGSVSGTTRRSAPGLGDVIQVRPVRAMFLNNGLEAFTGCWRYSA